MSSNFDDGLIGLSSEEDAIAIVRSEPTIIASFPSGFLTENVLFEALHGSNEVYELISDNALFTPKLVNRLILDNPSSLALIPSQAISRKHILNLVKHNGLDLREVRLSSLDHLINQEICIAAIKSNPDAHAFVPIEYQTSEYINLLLIEKPEFVQRIDVTQRDSQNIKSIIESNPILLRFLPMNERDYDSCVKAVTQDHTLIQYVPEDIYDSSEFMEFASELDYFKNPKEAFSPPLIRKSFANYLFDKNPQIYQYLPLSIKDKDLANKAVLFDPSNIFLTSSSVRVNGFVWETCISKYPEMYIHIPPDEQSDKVRIFIAREAAKKSNQNLGDLLSKNQKEVVDE